MQGDLQPEPILQAQFLDPPWALPNGVRLPGTGPVAADGWLCADDAYGAQMALRDRLIERKCAEVHALRPAAHAAAQELLAMALRIVETRAGYLVGADHVRRPDGVSVPLDMHRPLLTLGRLVQEDVCILQKTGPEHLMTGAILCFPASWSLDEKIDRPLTGIHAPVADYDADIARRVQRLFDAIRPDRPMLRANCLLYDDPALFQPRRENARRIQPEKPTAYVRTERQCLLRLPETNAVVFTIHTTVIAVSELTPQLRSDLWDYLGSSV